MESTAEKIKEIENHISVCDDKISDIRKIKLNYIEQLKELKKKEEKEDIAMDWTFLHTRIKEIMCRNTPCPRCPFHADIRTKQGGGAHVSCLLIAVFDSIREAFSHD